MSPPQKDGVAVAVGPCRPTRRDVKRRGGVLDQRRSWGGLCSLKSTTPQEPGTAPALAFENADGTRWAAGLLRHSQQRQFPERRREPQPKRHKLDRSPALPTEEIDALV